MSFDSTTFMESGKDFIITLTLCCFFHIACFIFCVFLSYLEDAGVYAILKSIILWHRNILVTGLCFGFVFVFFLKSWGLLNYCVQELTCAELPI